MSVDSADPLVSIIVITYNSSKYVLETLESAKAQTHQNIELIISDDGSQDGTVALCENWLVEHKDRFVHSEIITVEKNTGIPANCNRGVKAAHGEWIKLIAGDDILLKNCVFDNINFVEKNESKIVLSKIQLFAKENNKYDLKEIWPESSDFYNLSCIDQYQALLKGDNINITPSIFINRDALVELGLFDEEFKLIEDYPLWLKATKFGYKIDYMNRLTVNYRIHGDSICQSTYRTTNLVNPVSFRNEDLRKKYIYPNYNILAVWRFRYEFLSKKFFLNKENNQLNRWLLNSVILKYLNPFTYIFAIIRKITGNYDFYLRIDPTLNTCRKDNASERTNI